MFNSSHKYGLGLLTAVLILGLVAACGPRKRNWKTSVRNDKRADGKSVPVPRPPELPGKVGPGGIAKVGDAEGAQCESLTLNKSEPLFIDKAIQEFFESRSKIKDGIVDAQSVALKTGKIRVVSKSSDKLVIESGNQVFDFSKGVLDASGCFKVVLDEASLASGVLGAEEILIAVLWVSEKKDIVVQFHKAGSAEVVKSLKSKIDESGKEVEGPNQPLRVEELGPVEALMVTLSSPVHVLASFKKSGKSEGLMPEVDKAIETLDGTSSTILATHIVYLTSLDNQRILDGETQFAIINQADEKVSYFLGKQKYEEALKGMPVDLSLRISDEESIKFVGVSQSISKEALSLGSAHLVLGYEKSEGENSVEFKLEFNLVDASIPFVKDLIEKEEDGGAESETEGKPEAAANGQKVEEVTAVSGGTTDPASSVATDAVGTSTGSTNLSDSAEVTASGEAVVGSNAPAPSGTVPAAGSGIGAEAVSNDSVPSAPSGQPAPLQGSVSGEVAATGLETVLDLAAEKSEVAKDTPQSPLMLQKTTKINDLSRLFLSARLAEAKAKGLPNKNTMVSSISLYYALAILKNGAAGETEKKLAEVLLKSTGYNSNEVSQRLAELITLPAAASANGTDGKSGSFTLANSAWASSNLKFLFAPNFLDALKQSFKGESTNLDFSNSVSADVINKWVKRGTNGQIPTIINASTLSELQWVIINAAAFEGSWQKEGQKIDLNFAFADGKRKDVPGVRHSVQEVKFLDIGNGGFVAAVPFKGDKYSLVFRLSPSAGTMPNLVEQLPELMGTKSLTVSIDFPKFSFEDEVNMTSGSSIAKELGLEELFSSPNLSKLGADGSPARAVGLIKQKTMIELDQFGVKASAATAVFSARSALGPQVDKTILINRPFGFAIIENTSQTILFNGVVLDPTAK